MAVDSFMLFQNYSDTYLASESQVDFSGVSGDADPIGAPFYDTKAKGNVFEVTTFSFDVEQTINMSSQSSGAGAGKIQFNAFSVSRKIDKSTPAFFQNACMGTAFKNVCLGFRKASGVGATGLFFLRFDFRLVALKSMKWAHDDESPTEDLEFEYGGLQIIYGLQNPNGSITTQNPVGWNKITNKSDFSSDVKKLPAPIGGAAGKAA